MIERPELGGPIAALSNLWTFTEDIWGIILAVMLGVQGEAGVAIYHALNGTASRRSVLNEIAARFLNDELRADFLKLLKAMKGRAKERNDLVHGLWFHDPNQPDCLILAPRNTLSKFWVKGWHYAATITLAKRSVGERPDISGYDYSSWLVYTPEDFEAAQERILYFFKDQSDVLDKLLAFQEHEPLAPLGPPPQAGA